MSADLISALKKPRGIPGTLVTRDGTIGRGEVDAVNKNSRRQPLREAAALGQLVIHADGLDIMGCCVLTAWADAADRCLARGVRVCPVSRQVRPGVIQRKAARTEIDAGGFPELGWCGSLALLGPRQIASGSTLF